MSFTSFSSLKDKVAKFPAFTFRLFMSRGFSNSNMFTSKVYTHHKPVILSCSSSNISSKRLLTMSKLEANCMNLRAAVLTSERFYRTFVNGRRFLREIPRCGSLPLVHLHCNYTIRRKDYKFPELRPEDLEESFVRGSGPGGQAVNQTANCVVLKHIPTGTIVKCQATRSLQDNRKQARRLLEEKLDLEMHGENSYLSQLSQDKREGKIEKKKRAKTKLALKKAFKDREGIE